MYKIGSKGYSLRVLMLDINAINWDKCDSLTLLQNEERALHPFYSKLIIEMIDLLPSNGDGSVHMIFSGSSVIMT